MKRTIIKIDEDLCIGCGLCVNACQEGAIGMVDGKAKLLSENYCDGLGNCLPVCPTGAISFEEREAAPFDKESVKKNMQKENTPVPQGCPGRNIKTIDRNAPRRDANAPQSELSQWPVQIQLVPVQAPFFKGANLLIAADCTAFAYGDFHNRFIRNHIAIIGCPKLDITEYEHKLTDIIRHNDIKSVKIVRMEVPCCGGIEYAATEALKKSGKFIPWQVVVISTDGRIVGE